MIGVFAGFVDSAVGVGVIAPTGPIGIGLPPHVAIGTNKFASTAAAAVASVKYLQSGIVPGNAGLIGWGLMALFSALGASVVLSISADTVLGIVIAVLCILFLYVLLNPKFGREETIVEDRIMPMFLIGMGTGLGFYEGFLGPGTGSMLMVGYIKGAGFGMDRAATARILNFGGNVGSIAPIFAIAASINYRVTPSHSP